MGPILTAVNQQTLLRNVVTTKLHILESPKTFNQIISHPFRHLVKLRHCRPIYKPQSHRNDSGDVSLRAIDTDRNTDRLPSLTDLA